MRILEAIDQVNLRAGGPSRAVLDLSRAMVESGHDVTVACRFGPDIPHAWHRNARGDASLGPHAIVLPGNRWVPPGSAAASRIYRLVAAADVVHLHGVWEPFNLRLASMAHAANVPYVVTLRGMLDDWCMSQRGVKKRLYLAIVGRRFLEQAAIVQCTAAAELHQSRKWFPKGNAIVLPNLLDLQPYEDLPSTDAALKQYPFLSDGRPWLLFLGRLSAKKGVEYLVDAAAILRNSGVAVGVVVAGNADSPSYLDHLKARAAAAGIANDVQFVGHVDGSLKLALIQAATMMVIPTTQENFGFVFYESLAAGTPVITTPLIDTASELEKSGGCFLVHRQADAIASLTAEHLADRKHLHSIGLRAREWMMREHATRRIAARYEEMFRYSVETHKSRERYRR